MKPTINGIVIVEGKTDTQKLKQIFNVETIETNGSEISKETIELILISSKNNNIYLFLDPDQPGEKIRNTIIQNIDESINIFLSKKDMKKNTKKIGIAEATNESIINAFKNSVTFNKKTTSLTLEEYLLLNLDTFKKREFVCDFFKISPCNNKQLFKRFNMMNLNFDIINNIIKSYNE